MPRVAVVDGSYPPAVAFIRSLGRAGVPVIVGADSWLSAGRYSRFATEVHPAPSPDDIEAFVDWIIGGLRAGHFDLVAPTSDRVAFAMAEVLERLPERDLGCWPRADALRTCLFKLDFTLAMAGSEFPTPRTIGPRDIAGAVAAAEEIGYPVLIKPRSHLVDGGGYRGRVVRSASELIDELARLDVRSPLASPVACRDPHAAMPMVQQYLPITKCDVVSVSGCLDSDGSLLAVSASRKLAQWPPNVGVGTLFEALPPQPIVERAVEIVRELLGAGLFELEFLVDRESGEAWPIDLNPRAFGQITLDIATGNDLPRAWYRSVTGIELPADDRPVHEPPVLWCQGLPYYTGELVGLARGPKRVTRLRRLFQRLRYPGVGAMFAWYDLAPALVFVLAGLRHPGGLIKPFLRAAPERTAPGSARER